MSGKSMRACRVMPLILLAATQISCSDPMQQALPSDSTELLLDSLYQHLSKTDQLAILRYYDRRATFPSVAAIPTGTTVAAALAEQRTYETINLAAAPGGQGISSQTGETTPYFSVTLHTSKFDIGKAVIGLSGSIDVIDEFDQIVLSEEIRVDRPQEEYLLAQLWLRMTPKQEKIISKLDYKSLGVCFKPGLKIKQDDGSISKVDFPLCYKQFKNWKLLPEEKVLRR